jgi:hypothetical protein
MASSESTSADVEPIDEGRFQAPLVRGLNAWWKRVSTEPAPWQLTRFVMLRLLGVVYLTAFLALALQLEPLLGHDGLLPVPRFLERVAERYGAGWPAFSELPSLFWWDASTGFMLTTAWAGAALSLAVAMGATNAALMAALWFLYMSFTHVGQIFYSYGWEIQLLETGFLAIFLCPLRSVGPFPKAAPTRLVMGLFRWLVVRIMLGAGLIKLRGDACWTDLTCLVHHYETQPIPNPLSLYLHHLPAWCHTLGVLWNHLVELVIPIFCFGPRRARHIAGVLLIAFQLSLIVSGNLSFLNWLTLVPALACLDDTFWARVLPARLVAAGTGAAMPSRTHRTLVFALTALVLWLSIAPVQNLLADKQAMNTSFGALKLVNTYGAFGSVDQERIELIIEGQAPDGSWREYEFKCKPGALDRRPCVITPYHYRLDWQIWFAWRYPPGRQPWLVHLVHKLLQGNPTTLALFADNPFPDKPPRAIRILSYTYRFQKPGANGWWTRELRRVYLPPITADNPELLRYLRFQKLLPPA